MKQYLIIALLSTAHFISAMEPEIKTISSAETESVSLLEILELENSNSALSFVTQEVYAATCPTQTGIIDQLWNMGVHAWDNEGFENLRRSVGDAPQDVLDGIDRRAEDIGDVRNAQFEAFMEALANQQQREKWPVLPETEEKIDAQLIDSGTSDEEGLFLLELKALNI